MLKGGSAQQHTMADRFKIATNLVAEGVAVPELVKKKARPGEKERRGMEGRLERPS